MCFVKSPKVSASEVQEDAVQRKEADASLTKNQNNQTTSTFKENLKTSAVGLTDEANLSKKTLLGE